MRLGKVYHRIEESDYCYQYQRFTFYFSSMLYIKKFEKELSNYVDLETRKLNFKYNVNLESGEYLALSLYKRIEKRGFLVYYCNRPIKENETFTISLSALKEL